MFPLVTPSHPSYPAGIINLGHDPHDVTEHHECTGESKRAWLGFMYLLIGFGKLKQERDLTRSSRKNLIILSWPGSLNPCHGEGLHLGQATNLCQIILYRNQETRLK